MQKYENELEEKYYRVLILVGVLSYVVQLGAVYGTYALGAPDYFWEVIAVVVICAFGCFSLLMSQRVQNWLRLDSRGVTFGILWGQCALPFVYLAFAQIILIFQHLLN